MSQQIRDSFDEEFKKQLENFRGNVNIFNKFGNSLETIVKKKSTGKNILKSKKINFLEDIDNEYTSLLQDEAFNVIDVEDDYGNFYEKPEKKEMNTKTQELLSKLGREQISEVDYSDFDSF
ncbi:MAG: hypothetical protein GF364_08995 [Candidatus Lokiarchaeota archaeon]|nr:hypothetical protein [Candidatus Lokiarchaeota archaeon]